MFQWFRYYQAAEQTSSAALWTLQRTLYVYTYFESFCLHRAAFDVMVHSAEELLIQSRLIYNLSGEQRKKAWLML